MKTTALVFAMLALCLVGTDAHAHGYTVGDLQITHPWAKPSLKGVPNSAAYMTITNKGETDDRLVDVSSNVSEAVELHTMTMQDGIMRMRRLEGGVPLPAGETVVLEPGGKHIMLIGLKDRLKAGSRIPMTLTFKHAGALQLKVMVLDQQREAAKDGN